MFDAVAEIRINYIVEVIGKYSIKLIRSDIVERYTTLQISFIFMLENELIIVLPKTSEPWIEVMRRMRKLKSDK